MRKFYLLSVAEANYENSEARSLSEVETND